MRQAGQGGEPGARSRAAARSGRGKRSRHTHLEWASDVPAHPSGASKPGEGGGDVPLRIVVRRAAGHLGVVVERAPVVPDRLHAAVELVSHLPSMALSSYGVGDCMPSGIL